MQLSIRTPADFSFPRTVLSHGWCALLPFQLDRDRWILTRVLDVRRAKPVTVKISSGKRLLKIIVSRKVNESVPAKIIADVRHMLRLDDDLKPFYEVMATEKDFAWITNQGAGRLLRSPTVFEGRQGNGKPASARIPATDAQVRLASAARRPHSCRRR